LEGLVCCPEEGQIHAAKTRREMEDNEARAQHPSSDAGNPGSMLLIQQDFQVIPGE